MSKQLRNDEFKFHSNLFVHIGLQRHRQVDWWRAGQLVLLLHKNLSSCTTQFFIRLNSNHLHPEKSSHTLLILGITPGIIQDDSGGFTKIRLRMQVWIWKSWMNSVRYKGVRKITVPLYTLPKTDHFFGPKRKGFVSNPSYVRCYRWSFRNPSMKPSPARMVNPNPTRTWPCQRPRKTWQGDLGPAMVGHYVFIWKMIL